MRNQYKMRNYSVLAFIFALFVANSVLKGQSKEPIREPIQLSLANRVIPKTPPVKQQTTAKLSDHLVDTNGRKMYQPVDEGKSAILSFSQAVDTVIEKIKTVAVSAWDAVFEEDIKNSRIDQDVFRITTGRTTTIQSTDGSKVTIAPHEPVVVFNPEGQKMTVMFDNNGNIVPIPKEQQVVTTTMVTKSMPTPQAIAPKPIKKDSVAKVGKAIVEKVFKMDVTEKEDSSYFIYNGEVYKKMKDEEFETPQYKQPRKRKFVAEYDAPRVKKVRSADRINVELVVKPVKKTKIIDNDHFLDLYEPALRDGERYGVPYAISAAQGILEARGGRSTMAELLNNLFGIKCHGGVCRKVGCPHGYFLDDYKEEGIKETFRGYSSFEESIEDHIEFFLVNSNYKPCLACGLNDIGCWLYRLKLSGYATDKNYDRKLWQVMMRYKLVPYFKYDRQEVAQRLSQAKPNSIKVINQNQ